MSELPLFIQCKIGHKVLGGLLLSWIYLKTHNMLQICNYRYCEFSCTGGLLSICDVGMVILEEFVFVKVIPLGLSWQFMPHLCFWLLWKSESAYCSTLGRDFAFLAYLSIIFLGVEGGYVAPRRIQGRKTVKSKFQKMGMTRIQL